MPLGGHSNFGNGTITVTPEDGTTAAFDPAPLYITVGGTIKVRYPDGSTDTVTVPDNYTYNYWVTRVWSTGTTATGIKRVV